MPFLKHNLPYTEPLWHESDRKAQKDGYRSTFYYTNRYSYHLGPLLKYL
jgi:hypothetical protein